MGEELDVTPAKDGGVTKKLLKAGDGLLLTPQKGDEVYGASRQSVAVLTLASRCRVHGRAVCTNVNSCLCLQCTTSESSLTAWSSTAAWAVTSHSASSWERARPRRDACCVYHGNRRGNTLSSLPFSRACALLPPLLSSNTITRHKDDVASWLGVGCESERCY